MEARATTRPATDEGLHTITSGIVAFGYTGTVVMVFGMATLVAARR
jgi:hypothetical protein